MINLKFDGKTYQLKNSTNELLINEFEHICSILNDKEKNHIEKWSEIFIYLGVPEDVIDNFDSFDFIEMIKEFNIFKTDSTEFVKDIVLDGITYTAFDEKFKLTVKEMTLIESFITKNENRYLGEMLAVIYKRTDLDKSMTYDKAHLKFKAELIRKQVMADVAVPIIGFLSKKLINDYNLITDAN